MTHPAAPSRERGAYPRLTDFRTRWTDNDQFGHVNNALYYGFFDSAVNATLIEELGFDPLRDPAIFYVARTDCTFHAAAAYPAILEVGVRIGRLGHSSITYEIAVFEAGAALAAATGHFVHVCVDRTTERPVQISETWRAELARIYGSPPAGP